MKCSVRALVLLSLHAVAAIDDKCVVNPDGLRECHEGGPSGDTMSLLQNKRLNMIQQLWNEHASHNVTNTAPAKKPDKVAAVIEREPNTNARRRRSPSAPELRVTGAGWNELTARDGIAFSVAGKPLLFSVAGKPLDVSPSRGLNVVTLSPLGTYEGSFHTFDTHYDHGASAKFAEFLGGLAAGTPVMIAAVDEASRYLYDDAKAAIKKCGAAQIDALANRDSYALICTTSGVLLAEEHKKAKAGPATATCQFGLNAGSSA